MVKRLIAFLCVFALVFALFARVPVSASAEPASVSRASRSKQSHRPAPLVSAMFLILAGMGVSMLFEKKE